QQAGKEELYLVNPAAVVAGDEPDRYRDRNREAGGEHARLHRRTRAPDDAREDVAAELVRPEQVVARRVREHSVEVGRRGRVGGDPRREDRPEREARGDEEAGDRERAPRQAPSPQAPPAGAPPRDVGGSGVDVAHAGLATIRIRGLSSE